MLTQSEIQNNLATILKDAKAALLYTQESLSDSDHPNHINAKAQEGYNIRDIRSQQDAVAHIKSRGSQLKYVIDILDVDSIYYVSKVQLILLQQFQISQLHLPTCDINTHYKLIIIDGHSC